MRGVIGRRINNPNNFIIPNATTKLPAFSFCSGSSGSGRGRGRGVPTGSSPFEHFTPSKPLGQPASESKSDSPPPPPSGTGRGGGQGHGQGHPSAPLSQAIPSFSAFISSVRSGSGRGSVSESDPNESTRPGPQAPKFVSSVRSGSGRGLVSESDPNESTRPGPQAPKPRTFTPTESATDSTQPNKLDLSSSSITSVLPGAGRGKTAVTQQQQRPSSPIKEENRHIRPRAAETRPAQPKLSREDAMKKAMQVLSQCGELGGEDAVWSGYQVDGVADDAIARLDHMQKVFNAWTDAFDSSKGLYYVEPLRDATEYTISSIDASGGQDGFTGGFSFRPSINSFQYANAKAISSLAALKGNSEAIVSDYDSRAAAIKTRVQEALWNSTFEHFIDRYQVNNTFVRYWDPIRGRELVGYVPWTHSLPDDTPEYAEAWRHVLNSSELAGPHGLRTVEPSYQYYMRQYRYEGTNPECQWNGPVWPFQTTQVLTGLANFLNDYPKGVATGLINAADYTRLLTQYAQLHYNPERNGLLDLEEDYYPDTGSPIVGLKRSPHYFHSGFIDLILSGFVGIRPSANDTLQINPLADPGSIQYFRADHILYHGHEIAVQWDANGARYGTTGLVVEIDGQVVSSSATLSRLSITVSRQAPPATARRIAKSVQLDSATPYPRGSASTANASQTELYGSIDGRIWFFPETDVANGWSTPSGNGSEVWFQIDFGQETVMSAAEIAFFSDEQQGFDVPQSYRIQIESASGWSDLDLKQHPSPVANGITDLEWIETESSKVRLLLVPKSGVKVRLIELKIY